MRICGGARRESFKARTPEMAHPSAIAAAKPDQSRSDSLTASSARVRGAAQQASRSTGRRFIRRGPSDGVWGWQFCLLDGSFHTAPQAASPWPVAPIAAVLESGNRAPAERNLMLGPMARLGV
jgi:hypothetical protein